MSYQEKMALIGLTAGVLILAAYCFYVIGKTVAGAVDLTDLSFYAVSMLVCIATGIVVTIVIQIIFHILLSVSVAVKNKTYSDKEIEKAVDAAFVEDEMDRLIELRSGRIGYFIVGIGFIAGLVSIVLSFPPAVMLNILFISLGIGSLAGGAISIYYYRTGIR